MKHCLILGAVVAVCTMCLGQVNRATLSGTVTDTSGAVISNAKITAVQVSTQFTYSATTNQDGAYNFVGLPIGTYQVSGEHTGFARVVRDGVILDPSHDVRVDLQLAIGSATQVVEVKAEPTLLAERGTTYGVELQAPDIENLPLVVSGDKRNFTELLAAIPGVTNQGFQNNVFGGIGFTSQILIDGLSAEYDATVPGVMERPTSVESIANFQVIQTASAEYGQNGGGVMSVTTKSGTNQFHGAVFAYARNEAMDARNFFAQTASPDKEWEYGFTLGGPIRHDKTFFWGEYDGYRTSSGSSGLISTVPTALMEQGNFSQLLGPEIGTDVLGRPVLSGQIYDPTTSRIVDGQNVRDPFPGNIIPAANLSTISQTVQSYIPSPNVPNALVNNFIGSSHGTTSIPEYDAKITQMFGQSTLDVGYRIVVNNGTSEGPYPVILSGSNVSNQRNQELRLSYTLPIGAKMTSSFIAGADRQGGTGPVQKTASQFGIAGLYTTICSTQIQVQSYFGGNLGNGECDDHNNTEAFKYAETFTMLEGKHTVKFGANYDHWLSNSDNHFASAGYFQYDTAVTGLPGAFLSQTGAPYASFLLGESYAADAAPSGGIGVSTSVHPENWAWGLFAQDEYRATPRLTLNYGVRWDYQPICYVPLGAQSQFAPNISNPGAGGLFGALEYAGFGPNRVGSLRFSPTYPAAFAPRLGFAWNFLKDTVVRGSWGIYWTEVANRNFISQQGLTPQTILNDTDGGITPILNWQNGFPPLNSETTLSPTAANGQPTQFQGPNAAYPSMVMITNISVQHEFPHDIVMEAAYISNRGRHLVTLNGDQRNQLNYATYGSLGNVLDDDIYSAAAVSAGFTPPYAGFTGTVAQALRPYPQYQSVSGNDSTIDSSNFNSMMIKAEKRFAGGLSFQLGYTLSKNLSDTGGTGGQFATGIQNAYNPKAEYAVTSVDSRSIVVASYTYELPVGNGKRYLSGSGPVDKYVVGGWKVSGIQNYHTPAPASIGTNQNIPTAPNGLRANIVPGVNPYGPGSCSGDNVGLLILNPAAFTDPAPFSFGDTPPYLNNVRRCGGKNENLSLTKSFPLLAERYSVQFGADFFNVFNRHIFGYGTNVDSGFGAINGASTQRQGQVFFRMQF